VAVSGDRAVPWAFSVVGERSLWLYLSSLSDAEKRDLLDTKVDPKGLFVSPCNRHVTPGRRREKLFRPACLTSWHPPSSPHTTPWLRSSCIIG